MAAFKFRMDFLIKARKRKEEEAMARLAQRLASIKELEREITGLDQYKARLQEELAEKIHSGALSIPLLSMYREYDLKLSRDLARLHEFLRLSRREEAKERAALTRASIDRKVMEKLKEKKKAEFVAEQMYLEQNNLEEMAALAKGRRDREEFRQSLEAGGRSSSTSPARQERLAGFDEGALPEDQFQLDRPSATCPPLGDED